MGQFAVVDVKYSAARPGIPVPVPVPVLRSFYRYEIVLLRSFYPLQ